MQPLVESAAFIPNITYNYVIRENSLSNYQSREVIDMTEIRQHIENHKYLKAQSITLRGKPYFEIRVTKMMLNMFYVIIGVIRNKSKLSEKINKDEIRQAIHHPLQVKDIIKFKEYKGINLLFWMIGVIPSPFSYTSICILGKLKKLI
jgi:hypothetical protein